MLFGRKLIAAFSIAALLVAGSASAKDVYKLTYHSAFGEAGLNEASRVWMDEVEKRTKGRVKFNRVFGGSLGKFAGQPTGIKARSFDVGQVSAVYNPGLYARGTVSILPFLTDDVDAHNKAIHEMFNSPDFKKEYDALNQKFLFNGSWIFIQMVSYDEVKTMKDLASKKIRAHGGSAEALTAAGITSYAIPFGELAAAAEKKVVTVATMGGPSGVVDFGFGDIFDYWYEGLDWYYMPMTMVMNKDAWNELPADLQKIIEETNKDMVARTMELVWAQENAAAKTLTGKFGAKSVKFNEVDKLKAAGKESWEEWKKGMAKKGIDGGDLIDRYYKLMEKNAS